MVLQWRDVIVAHCQLCTGIDLVPDGWKDTGGWMDAQIARSHEASRIREVFACPKGPNKNSIIIWIGVFSYLNSPHPELVLQFIDYSVMRRMSKHSGVSGNLWRCICQHPERQRSESCLTCCCIQGGPGHDKLQLSLEYPYLWESASPGQRGVKGKGNEYNMQQAGNNAIFTRQCLKMKIILTLKECIICFFLTHKDPVVLLWQFPKEFSSKCDLFGNDLSPFVIVSSCILCHFQCKSCIFHVFKYTDHVDVCGSSD